MALSRQKAALLLILVIAQMLITVIIFMPTPKISQPAPITAAKTQISTFSSALDAFQVDIGRYPISSEGFNALIKCPASVSHPEKWRGPYIHSSVPLDPWGTAYHYACPPERPEHDGDYEVISAGHDCKFGTDDDITNYNYWGRD